jgi:hypothetical protein
MVQDCSKGTAMNLDRLRGVLEAQQKRVRKVETLAGVDEVPKGEQVWVRIPSHLFAPY